MFTCSGKGEVLDFVQQRTACAEKWAGWIVSLFDRDPHAFAFLPPTQVAAVPDDGEVGASESRGQIAVWARNEDRSVLVR